MNEFTPQTPVQTQGKGFGDVAFNQGYVNPLTQSFQFSQHQVSVGPQYEMLLKEKCDMTQNMMGI
jgi:hypothetical protein